MSSVSEIKERVAGVKTRAGFFLSQRRKDLDLYQLLADTLAICEEVEREGMLEEMRDAVRDQAANGRNRVYTEQGSDVYVVVGRAVFEPEINRAASWRYSAALREAAQRQIRSHELADWLRANGGVNTLFRGRGVMRRTLSTKTLHLNQQITVPKDQEFTVVLQMDGRGFFNVKEVRS